MDFAGVRLIYVPVWAGGCAFAHGSVAGRTEGVELFADPCQRLRGCRHLQPSTGSDGRRALPVKMPARMRDQYWRVEFHILNILCHYGRLIAVKGHAGGSWKLVEGRLYSSVNKLQSILYEKFAAKETDRNLFSKISIARILVIARKYGF